MERLRRFKAHLESVFRGNSFVGSNPLSAINTIYKTVPKNLCDKKSTIHHKHLQECNQVS